MRTFLAITLMALLIAGCSSAPGVPGSYSYIRQVVLSENHPEDAFLKARLVAIAEDGTTTIEVSGTGEKITAAPGGYFASTAYGKVGLRLLSASADKKEARLLRAWGEIK
jgi:hypothetical protein